MSILNNLKYEFERRLKTESLARIRVCVDLLSEEELWNRPNNNLVSVANLILHLNGNVKQWILSGVGDHKDDRERDNEFDQTKRIPTEELISTLTSTLDKSIRLIGDLSEESLLEYRNVQGYNETVLSILIHVIEHFSYHTAQITYYTKYIKDVDTKYYEGDDLNAKS